MNKSNSVVDRKTLFSLRNHFGDRYGDLLVESGFQVEASNDDVKYLLKIGEIDVGHVVVIKASSPVSSTDRPMVWVTVYLAEGKVCHPESTEAAKRVATELRNELGDALDLDLQIVQLIDVDVIRQAEVNIPI
jgi:hypothetical protein